MTSRDDRRDSGAARHDPTDGLDAVFDVRIAEGVEARRLAVQQARVIYEVIAWWARNRPSPGTREGG